jgi:hypothetical protein
MMIFLIFSPFSNVSLKLEVYRKRLKDIVLILLHNNSGQKLTFFRRNLAKSEANCQDRKRPSVSFKSLREMILPESYCWNRWKGTRV